MTMTRRTVIAGAAAVLAGPVFAQDRGLAARVVMSGHSLTDPIREPLQDMVRAAGGPRDSIALSTIPGSPLEWRWNNPPGLDLRARVAEFDVVVLTERVALSNTVPYHHSEDFALRFAQLGWGVGAEVLLYATWVTLDTGPDFAGQGSDPDAGLPWRERLDREQRAWEAIRTHVNDNRPPDALPMRMIPVIAVMAAIYDEIEAGRAPITDIRMLFADDIHPSPLGAWLASLTHFAVLYRRNPAGLTRPIRVSAAVARWYEDLVWRVVSEHPATGLG